MSEGEQIDHESLGEGAHLQQELAALQQRLRQIEAERLALYAAVSHDLRAPLVTIVGFAGRLLKSLGDKIDTTAYEELEIIYKEGQRMWELVDNLYDMARYAPGATLNFTACALKEALEDAVDTLRLQAKARSQSLLLALTSDLPAVKADEVALQRVLVNLVGNAIQYTPEGSIIQVTARQEKGWIQIDVGDNGPGIPEAEIGYIFEPFYRSGGKSAGTRGAGLGLAISRQIVTMHGGDIWVSSSGQSGTVFSFTLPIAE